MRSGAMVPELQNESASNEYGWGRIFMVIGGKRKIKSSDEMSIRTKSVGVAWGGVALGQGAL